jgi:hypothetical protein
MQSKMNNTKKLANLGTQDTGQRQTNKNNVNYTWTLLQTTGGKDEPNIVFNAEIVMVILLYHFDTTVYKIWIYIN